ncbi:MAG: ferrous iron transport protein A [Proteobacteria bacterium]|nr:MAG: ferrous iron transport protein A [Pseudomonadota bacterium]
MTNHAPKSLPDLSPGERATVETIDSGPAFVGRMASMGLSPGVRITVTQNFPKRPLIVMVRNTFIALSRLEAGWIQVGGGE